MIKVGDLVPSARIVFKGQPVNVQDYFKERTGVIFGSPGAFGPVCTQAMMPGLKEKINEIKSLVGFVGCITVNDPYVVKEWARHVNLEDEVTFIADGNRQLVARLGFDQDFSSLGMGVRCRRFALIVGRGSVVRWVGLDEEAHPQALLRQLRLLSLGAKPALGVSRLTRCLPPRPALHKSVLEGHSPLPIQSQYRSATVWTHIHTPGELRLTFLRPLNLGELVVGSRTFEPRVIRLVCPAAHVIDSQPPADLEIQVIHEDLRDSGDVAVLSICCRAGVGSGASSDFVRFVRRAAEDRREIEPIARTAPPLREMFLDWAAEDQRCVTYSESLPYATQEGATISWFVRASEVVVAAEEVQAAKDAMSPAEDSAPPAGEPVSGPFSAAMLETPADSTPCHVEMTLQ